MQSMLNQLLRLSAAVLISGSILSAQKTELDKNKQKLRQSDNPPLVATGETSRLVFNVSPLSGNGLLSDQTRDALKAILKLNGNAPIVHIRAFSAGNGDIRRIPQIVSEVLADRHGPLPSVSVLQTGALPLEDAQVVLETVSVGKKDLNKNGLTFHPAEAAVAAEPTATVESLLQKSADRLAAKMQGQTPLSVTCFVSDLDQAPALLQIVATRFAGAATDLVQTRRLAWQTEASCEGVSRGGGLKTPRIAFSGTQVSFGVQQDDAATAFQRLDKAMTEAGAPQLGNAALLRIYLLSPGTAAVALKQAGGPAPVTSISVEGVGAASAGFAIDATAPAR
jgi:hypothetical protein